MFLHYNNLIYKNVSTTLSYHYTNGQSAICIWGMIRVIALDLPFVFPIPVSVCVRHLPDLAHEIFQVLNTDIKGRVKQAHMLTDRLTCTEKIQLYLDRIPIQTRERAGERHSYKENAGIT